MAHVDAVHALSYAGLHLWFAVLPYSPLTLRLPSVAAAGVGAVLVAVLGTRLAGRRAGLASGLVGDGRLGQSQPLQRCTGQRCEA